MGSNMFALHDDAKSAATSRSELGFLRTNESVALTTASADMSWRDGWSAGVTFDDEFSGSSGYTGSSMFRYQW